MLHSLSRPWLRWASIIGLTLTGWAFFPLIAWAQVLPAEVRDPFLADPEFAEPRDPLLPELQIMRRLSPLEKLELEAELDLLSAEAESLYLRGQTELAYQTWVREIRLRRILGYAEEIQAMQRVGLRVWEDSRTQETQLFTLRLRQIQADLLSQELLRISLLEEIAAMFEILRDVDSAIALYETLVVKAAQVNNQAERQRLLENLANLQESWFRFEVAGKTYQSLIVANGTGDPLKQVQYLQGAIRNYQGAGQLDTAIGYQRRLLAQYEATGTIQPIPTLMLAIARNYRDLDELEQARTYYLTTYSTALGQNQSDIAREAVQDLADVYLALERTDDVLYLYEQRIALERISYNGYGIMQVFEQLGQLYETEEDPDAAISAYREGLVIANHLGHREAYFSYKLLQLLYAQDRLAVVPAEQHQHSAGVEDLQEPQIWQGN